MALNIKNAQVESLVAEVAKIAGESKTEAVRKALQERRDRLFLTRMGAGSERRLWMLLQNEIWPRIPAAQKGVRLTKKEEESILGYGEAGI
ncbi:MAG: type II toxin-antitoxin system VapB family antitoxin [Caldilineaceae bacterium]